MQPFYQFLLLTACLVITGRANHSLLAEPWLNHRPEGRPPDVVLVMQAAVFEGFAERELRGDKPEFLLRGRKPEFFPTWEAFWRAEYQSIRKNSESPEQARESIECAHYVLQRAGLPTYDP